MFTSVIILRYLCCRAAPHTRWLRLRFNTPCLCLERIWKPQSGKLMLLKLDETHILDKSYSKNLSIFYYIFSPIFKSFSSQSHYSLCVLYVGQPDVYLISRSKKSSTHHTHNPAHVLVPHISFERSEESSAHHTVCDGIQLTLGIVHMLCQQPMERVLC